MDKKALQYYAVWAKNNLEQQIEISLKTLGINSEKDIKEARKVGDFTIIEGDMNSYPADIKEKRDNIIKLIKTDGYKQVVEEFAYTWFNRIIALRFMEVHDFLPHGFRVLSSRNGGIEPEIMKNLSLIKDELEINLEFISPLLSQGKIDEAYCHVLFHQCKALSGILPMLFSEDQDYLELLLPKVLLKGETVITKLLEINEEDFLNDVEVIGWLYQFYISQKKDEVFESQSIITKDTLPAVTQLFTPDWIVRYMVENSVGRIWLESNPNSPLKSSMKYYIEDADQENVVQRKLDEIKYNNVNLEEIRIIEPCCGSGHILVYIFDLLYRMYDEKGYINREIPTIILKNNLVGLDVDKRAAQLASFSLVMKARTLNSRFFNTSYYVRPKIFEIWDSRTLLSINYEAQLRELNLLSNEEIKNIKWLVETFRYAKTIGSLLKIEKKNFDEIESIIEKVKKQGVATIFNMQLLNEGIDCLEHLLAQAKVMSAKYDAMITNPPYIGSSNMESTTKDYLYGNYPNSKADMFAMFMETSFVKKHGFRAIINMQGWMFLSSYKNLRKDYIDTKTFVSMIHLGTHAFDTIGGDVVNTTAFITREFRCKDSYGKYISLTGKDNKEISFLNNDYPLYIFKQSDFNDFPGYQIAYWANNEVRQCFRLEKIEEYYFSDGRNITGNNNKYLRYHWEVDRTKIGKNKKWLNYVKGGGYRKWFGNIIDVVDWSVEARTFYRKNSSSRIIEEYLWYKSGITWNLIASGNGCFRLMIGDNTFDMGGPSVFPKNDQVDLIYTLAFLNSKVVSLLNSVVNQTINYQVEHILSTPIIFSSKIQENVNLLAQECIKIVKEDWDSFEISNDFIRHPLIKHNTLLSETYELWRRLTIDRFEKVKSNEEKINSLFIDLFNLNKELDSNVDTEKISITLADAQRDVKSLISYLIGIEMGRYSLDIDGITYAGGAWNTMNYITFLPNEEGIVPIYSQIGMSDGLTAKIIQIIKIIYCDYYYKQNIDFIADTLGKKNNESSEETLNRYLNNEFYADHLKMYQKRPIYWMFSSGKKNAFKCLIYMHRYSEDTLAIINSKYFLNESARLNIEVNDTRLQLETADGKDKLRLEKQYRELLEKQKEMIEYGQVLDHMANQYIHLDLDDGVKVNYAKFQEIEIVNDNGTKVKKDLLVPIK